MLRPGSAAVSTEPAGGDLAEGRDVGEARADQGHQLPALELAHVEGVVLRPSRGSSPAPAWRERARRRPPAPARSPPSPAAARSTCSIISSATTAPKLPSGKRCKVTSVALLEAEVRQGVVEATVLDRPLVDVDADDALGGLGPARPHRSPHRCPDQARGARGPAPPPTGSGADARRPPGRRAPRERTARRSIRSAAAVRRFLRTGRIGGVTRRMLPNPRVAGTAAATFDR